jgi:N-acetylmuramoyl-L-alanine amidase
VNANALTEQRMGVMVHFSAGTFASTVDWCKRAKSGVSYNRVVRWDGKVELIVPERLRAWHAGRCQSSDPRLPYTDANSAFEGIALSGGPSFGPPTRKQVSALVKLIRERFEANGWPLSETWRIVGHDSEAFPRGRKDDPTGKHKDAPWLDLNTIRREVAK